MTYKFVEHTADVKFIASGKTLEEAFIASFEALKETVSGNIAVLDQTKKEFSAEGTDLNNLLYKFMEEFLFLLDAEDFLASKIDKIEIDKEKFTLKATIGGDKAQNYNFTNDVKAVTYNDMHVRFNEEKQEWNIQVVLDV
jgi:SHS2 domain-containing protein